MWIFLVQSVATHTTRSSDVSCAPYLLQPRLWTGRGQILRAENVRAGGAGEEAGNDAGLGPGVHLSNTFNTGLSCESQSGLRSSSRGRAEGSRQRVVEEIPPTYLFLCAIQHADGLDVVGVVSQSPLSFDSFIDSLTNVHRLQSGQTQSDHFM